MAIKESINSSQLSGDYAQITVDCAMTEIGQNLNVVITNRGISRDATAMIMDPEISKSITKHIQERRI